MPAVGSMPDRQFIRAIERLAKAIEESNHIQNQKLKRQTERRPPPTLAPETPSGEGA